MDRLQFQFDWKFGTRLKNLQILVCQDCYDKPQESGRTIILPPDPVPIMNARPENYVNADNPLSAIGANASPLLSVYGSQIGNLTGGGGVPAAFNSNTNKPFWMSAYKAVSNTNFENYVGINWGGDVSDITAPSSLIAPVVKHTLSSVRVTAPNNQPFLNSAQPASYRIDGSPNAVSWATLASGTTAGSVGESISVSVTGGSYQFHRFALQGDGTSVGIAQAQFYVSDAAPNDI